MEANESDDGGERSWGTFFRAAAITGVAGVAAVALAPAAFPAIIGAAALASEPIIAVAVAGASVYEATRSDTAENVGAAAPDDTAAHAEYAGDAAEEPHRKRNRWGDGLDAPAAGARDFFPSGYTPSNTVAEAITAFGHEDKDVARVTNKGQCIAKELRLDGHAFDEEHAASIYGYTEEEPTDLYGKLNRACRTPGEQAEKKLNRYRDYLYHMGRACDNLPPHIGKAYRGMNATLNSTSYKVGCTITWQQFSSASKKQHVARTFTKQQGLKLIGTFFVIECKTAKAIEEFSAYPEEEEVLLKYNTFFKVVRKAGSGADKRQLLDDLSAYDLSLLDVYILKEI
jgi:hypothetical protein